MSTIRFEDIKPFVRYTHIIENEVNILNFPVTAYDSRLFYCTCGRGRMEIGGNTYSVATGTLLVWNPGVSYRYFPDKDEPMHFLGINFDYTFEAASLDIPIPPDRSELYENGKATVLTSFDDAPAFENPIVLDNMFALCEKLTEIHREYTHRQSFFELRCSSLLANVLASVVLIADGKEQSRKQSVTVGKIIEYLNENYKSNISNETIGAAFGYHPNYVNQLFSKSTGESLHAYLLGLRVMQAIHLLQETDLPVSEICYSVGFKDFAHFSKYFKKKTGRSPSDFRI